MTTTRPAPRLTALERVIHEAQCEFENLQQMEYDGTDTPAEYVVIARAVAAHLASEAVIERMAAASCYDHEGENAPFTFADNPVSDWWNCRPDHERAHYRAMTRAALDRLGRMATDDER